MTSLSLTPGCLVLSCSSLRMALSARGSVGFSFATVEPFLLCLLPPKPYTFSQTCARACTKIYQYAILKAYLGMPTTPRRKLRGGLRFSEAGDRHSKFSLARQPPILPSVP